jgi:type I restriction enzyme S subunit
MSEWKSKSLGDLADTQLGKMLNRGKQSGNHTVPYLRSINVQWGNIDTSDLNEMDILPSEIERFTVRKGDLLVCEGGESGRVAVWNRDESIGFQNALHRVRSKGEVSNKYLYYYFEWLVRNGLIEHLFNGVTIKHFPQQNLRAVKIEYPPIDEQHKIVEILEDHLSRLDAALADVKQAKLKVTQFKVALLREIFEGESDWDLIPMKLLGSWGGGGTPSKANSLYWTNGTVPWLSPKDMGPREITQTEDKITEDACLHSTVRKFPADSVVLVVRSGILERRLPIAITKMETTLNQDMKAITFSSTVNPKFGFYAMLALEQDILNKCRKSGTTVASINTESLMKYELRVPELPVQERAVEYAEAQLTQVDKSLSSLEAALKMGKSLRRSLLQAAFTGQLTNEVAGV